MADLLRIVPEQMGHFRLYTNYPYTPHYPTTTYSERIGSPIMLYSVEAIAGQNQWAQYSDTWVIGGPGTSYNICGWWMNVALDVPQGAVLSEAKIRLVWDWNWDYYEGPPIPLTVRIRVATQKNIDTESWTMMDAYDRIDEFCLLTFSEAYVDNVLSDEMYAVLHSSDFAALLQPFILDEAWTPGDRVMILIEPLIPDPFPDYYICTDKVFYYWPESPAYAESIEFEYNGGPSDGDWGLYLLLDVGYVEEEEGLTVIFSPIPCRFVVTVDDTEYPATHIQIDIGSDMMAVATIAIPGLTDFEDGQTVTITGYDPGGGEHEMFCGSFLAYNYARGPIRQTTTLKAVEERTIKLSNDEAHGVRYVTARARRANGTLEFMGEPVPGANPGEWFSTDKGDIIASAIRYTLNPDRAIMRVITGGPYYGND